MNCKEFCKKHDLDCRILNHSNGITIKIANDHHKYKFSQGPDESTNELLNRTENYFNKKYGVLRSKNKFKFSMEFRTKLTLDKL